MLKLMMTLMMLMMTLLMLKLKKMKLMMTLMMLMMTLMMLKLKKMMTSLLYKIFFSQKTPRNFGVFFWLDFSRRIDILC